MVLEGTSQSQSDIDNFIAHKWKHIVLKVLIKDLFSLVHDLFAHNDK